MLQSIRYRQFPSRDPLAETDSRRQPQLARWKQSDPLLPRYLPADPQAAVHNDSSLYLRRRLARIHPALRLALGRLSQNFKPLNTSPLTPQLILHSPLPRLSLFLHSAQIRQSRYHQIRRYRFRRRCARRFRVEKDLWRGL